LQMGSLANMTSPLPTLSLAMRRLRFAFVATLLGAAGGVSLASSSASANAAVDPFTSSWDLPLASNATVLPGSSTMVANLVSQYENKYGSVAVNGGTWSLSDPNNQYWGIPIVTVPANQAPVPIKSAPDQSDPSTGCNDFTVSTGAGTGPKIPIPASASALVSGSGDSTLIVYQPSTSTEWELWQADYSAARGWTACDGGKLTDLDTSTGTFPAAGGYGESASGISYLGTAITEADIESGAIDHVIAMDANVDDCNRYVYPATRGDCPSDPGQVSEGSYLRFPTSLAMPSGMTPFARMVFKAIQSYGAVITDQSGGVAIEAENGYDWTYEGHTGTDPLTAAWDGQLEYHALDGMPWSELQVVAPTQDAAPSPSGVTTLALPAGSLHQHYRLALSAPDVQRWKLVMGTLPSGLHLSSHGVIHGIPTASGNSTVVVEMRSHRSSIGVVVLTIRIT
jgi:hypothetical protein